MSPDALPSSACLGRLDIHEEQDQRMMELIKRVESTKAPPLCAACWDVARERGQHANHQNRFKSSSDSVLVGVVMVSA